MENTKLGKAILSVVELKDVSILKDSLVINLLSDYSGFSEHPSSKNIFKNVISEGIIDKILFEHSHQLGLSEHSQNYVNELYEKFGFRKDVATYVINSIIVGLGYEIKNDNIVEVVEDIQSVEENIPVPSSSNSIHLTFRDIEINGPAKVISENLKKLGYVVEGTMDDGYILTGSFAGVRDCTIYVVESEYTHETYRIMIAFPERQQWYQLEPEYMKLKNMFTQKYGEPDSNEFFLDPYEDGDGYEMTALSSGNCIYNSTFNTDKGSIRILLAEHGQVLVSYEDLINMEIHDIENDSTAFDDI